MRRKRKERKKGPKHCRCHAFFDFAKRAAYMLLVLLVAAILISSVGGEAFNSMSFVKEAATALAEAAGAAFGGEEA